MYLLVDYACVCWCYRCLWGSIKGKKQGELFTTCSGWKWPEVCDKLRKSPIIIMSASTLIVGFNVNWFNANAVWGVYIGWLEIAILSGWAYNEGRSLRTAMPVKTKHWYSICTMLDQRRRRWADVVQMLYKRLVFARILNYSIDLNIIVRILF